MTGTDKRFLAAVGISELTPEDHAARDIERLHHDRLRERIAALEKSIAARETAWGGEALKLIRRRDRWKLAALFCGLLAGIEFVMAVWR